MESEGKKSIIIMDISDEPNSHLKVSSRVEDCPYTYILPKDHLPKRCGTLIGLLETWMGNGPMEIVQAQHLGNTQQYGPLLEAT